VQIREIEERLKSVVKKSCKQRILFYYSSTIHTCGLQEVARAYGCGQHLAKPTLALVVNLRLSGNTLDEYQNTLKDGLSKDVSENNGRRTRYRKCHSILRGIKKNTKHRKVQIKDDAIIAAVDYPGNITCRFLPDKTIDLMDEAASKLHAWKSILNPKNWMF
jgi:ATP-dependent Clp protease ATP-binding subunit ClpA